MMRQTQVAFGAGLVRLGPLDGLRGIAALVIVLGFQAQALFVEDSFQGAGPVVEWFHVWGWIFADLFFVISGFVFAHVYLGGRGLGSRDDLASFAVGRIARLYPLHLLLLILCAGLYWDAPQTSVPAFIAHLFMLQAVVQPAAQAFNASAWLLSAEAICCLFFALALHAGRRSLAIVTGAAILVSTGILLWHGLPGGPWSQDLAVRGLLGFFAGQVIWRRRAALRRIPATVLMVVAGLGLAIAMGEWSPVPALSLLAWPSLVLLALRIPLLESRPMIWLGDRSYVIFLLHLPLLDLIVRITGKLDGSALFVVAATLCYGAAVLLVSEIVYRVAEVPTRRLVLRRGLDTRDAGLIRAVPGRG
jgi:peptidoglycan/LPS O-acetylase OafA/YrhL